MTVDFRKDQPPSGPIVINGEAVEEIDSFKYLGVIIDKKLTFTEHVTAVHKKCQQRLHVLRRLRSFQVDPQLLLFLYRSIIESLLTYCNTCFFPMLSVSNRNKLLKVAHVASKIIGLPTPSLSDLNGRATLRKARAIAADTDHPLHSYFELLPSGRRYRCIKCSKTRYSGSFVPQAVKALNGK